MLGEVVGEPASTVGLGFAKAAGFRMVLTAFTRASSLVAFALVVRRGGTAVAGDLFFMLAGGLILATLLGLGLESAVSRLVATAIGSHHDERAYAVLSTALRLNAAASAVALGALVVTWELAGRPHRIALLIGSGFIAASTSAGLIGGSYLRARGQTTKAELLASLTSLTFFLLVVSHALGWPESKLIAVPLRLLAEIPLVAVIVVMAWRAVRRADPSGSRSHLIDIIGPLWLTAVAWVVIQQSDVFLLGILRGKADVAAYTPFLKIADIAGLPFGLIGVYLLPEATRRFARADHRGLEDLFVRSLQLAWIGTAPVLTVLAVVPRGALNALFGNVASPHLAAVSRLLALAYLANGLFGLCGIMLQAIGSRRALVRCVAVGVSTCLLVNVVAIPRWGVVGAALGTAAGFVAFAGAHGVVLFRDHHISPLHTRVLVPVVASIGFAALLRAASPGDGIVAVVVVAASSFAVAAAASALASRSHRSGLVSIA